MIFYLLNIIISVTMSLAGANERNSQAIISCATHPLTSSYYLGPNSDDSNFYTLYINHHNGVEHAPLFDGTVTGFTIELMQRRFEDVKRMGDLISLNIKKENCILKETRVFCFDNQPTQIGSLPVQSFSFSAEKSTVIASGTKFNNVKVALSYRLNSEESHTLSTKYYLGSCILNTGQGS